MGIEKDTDRDKKIEHVKKDIQRNIDRLSKKAAKAQEELDRVYLLFINGEGSQWDALQECGLKVHKLYSRKTELERKKKYLKTHKEIIKEINRGSTPPEEYYKYDNYDAYEIPRTEFLDDFIDRHEEYVMNGGKFGLPITSLPKMQFSLLYEIVGGSTPQRFTLNGKALYFRIVYRMRPLGEVFEDIKTEKNNMNNHDKKENNTARGPCR